MLSRFITAALSATTGDRNASVSSSTETPTTNAITSQIRSSSSAVMSASTGVAPVTCTPSGSTSARRCVSSSVVASSAGAVVGSRTRTAAPPVGETTGSPTPATPGTAASSARRSPSSPAGTASRSTAIRNGPLAPGPNASSIRSLACRVVDSAGWALMSAGHSRRSVTGVARASRRSSAPSAHGSGRRPIRSAQRAANGVFVVAGVTCRRTFRGSTRVLASPRTAGTTVSAAAITLTTPIAVAMPKVA